MAIWEKKKTKNHTTKTKPDNNNKNRTHIKMTSISKYTEQKYGQKLQIINHEDDGVSFLRN